MARNQQSGCIWGVTNFPVGKWILDRIGHAFFHCSTERPIRVWVIYHFPATTQPLEHFIYVTIKSTLCMCASFLLLGFIWIAWICSLGGPGDHFYSHQSFVLPSEGGSLCLNDKKRLFFLTSCLGFFMETLLLQKNPG